MGSVMARNKVRVIGEGEQTISADLSGVISPSCWK